MSCTHHDPTNHFNYFRQIRQIDGRSFITCMQCHAEWTPACRHQWQKRKIQWFSGGSVTTWECELCQERCTTDDGTPPPGRFKVPENNPVCSAGEPRTTTEAVERLKAEVWRMKAEERNWRNDLLDTLSLTGTGEAFGGQAILRTLRSSYVSRTTELPRS